MRECESFSNFRRWLRSDLAEFEFCRAIPGVCKVFIMVRTCERLSTDQRSMGSKEIR